MPPGASTGGIWCDPTLYLDGIPHDLFTFLRRECPVYFNPEPDDPDHGGFWALTRYQDIVQVSKNPKRFSSDSAWGGHRIFDEQRRRLSVAAPAERPEPPEQSDIKSMISMDPPEHSRYRGTILPGMKRRQGDGPWKRASAIRDGARKILEDFAAAARSAGPGGIDFVKHVAVELPIQMLAELFQVPASRHDDLFRWSNAIVSQRATRRCAPSDETFGDGRSAGRR